MDKQKYLGTPPLSYWIASTPKTDYPPLDKDVTVDVAIIGGGIVGIFCAYLLTLEGLSVAVIEADRILHGTTAHTTAKLTSQHELIYDKLITQFGDVYAKQYAEANEHAIRLVRKIAEEKKIDCDLSTQDAFVFVQNEQNLGKIKKEVDSALKVGIKAEFVKSIPFDIEIQGAVCFKDQAQFHPLKFLTPLAKEIVEKGNSIYEYSRVVEVEEKGRLAVVVKNGSKVTADHVIVASHYPFINKEGFYFARIYVERSYVLALKAKEKFPGGMYINAESPSRSLRSLPTEVGELIMVIGDEHKTGQGEDTIKHYEALMDFAARLFTVEDIPYRWSAQDCMTVDGLPYVGLYTKNSPDLYVATGYGKWGMSNSIASAVIIKDLITHGDNPWKEVYNPSRKTIGASAGKFIVENANVVGNLIAGKLSPLPNDIDLSIGEAQVVKIDGHRAGVYKDENGELHTVDTTCTHLGCEANWNSAEKSWDCPCHGSRFAYTGDVIEGPANKPLNTEENTNIVERVTTDKF